MVPRIRLARWLASVDGWSLVWRPLSIEVITFGDLARSQLGREPGEFHSAPLREETKDDFRFHNKLELCRCVGNRGGSDSAKACSNRRANALAADLLAAGLGHQAKVAAYLWNGPEYLETYFGAFKVGLVPVNTNYRYGAEEIRYLFENSDAEAVVFHASFAPLLESVKAQLPKVKRWYCVADHASSGAEVSALPDWALDYEAIIANGLSTNVVAPWGRTGDDMMFLYTGGTTGMPKGVMWRQDDIFRVLGYGGNALYGADPVSSLQEIGERSAVGNYKIPRQLPACPLMHGTGQFSAFIALALGGVVVTLPSRTFSPAELFEAVAEHKLNALVIVGDAFARPLLSELNANPGRWDLSSLHMISSSGVMWSTEVKEGLLAHLPEVILFDSYGSSEAVGLGASVSTKDSTEKTAKFALGATVHVFTDENIRVEPGSELTGFVAISGYLPMGYYKDPEKTAKTFRTIDGTRYSVPGDYAQVHADGSLHLLGRGSVCINSGGEKIFPEEVEEVLKQHGFIRDAVCVGLPDDRFGEIICALIELSGTEQPEEAQVIEFVRARLARYKAPRMVMVVPTIGRSPAGKVDYKALTTYARSASQR
jgi:3-oxocholest-4-en-26-oate---CoA ligase